MLAAADLEEGNVKTLRIAEDLTVPLDVVTQTLAAIGRKGAGKTYLATGIAERMLDASAQVVALDPVGNWWGLRVGADGKSKGKDIFVLGGDHGHVQIAPEHGARIARWIVEKGASAVLDISGFRLGERKRFAADFGEELLHLKKRQRSPVHLFIEEAQLLIPQRVGPDEARMVGAYEQLVRLGRNYGIGCTLVTQRPQSVNKEVLSQVECLCVLQVTGPHERKALEEWVQEVGADRKLVGELPGLGRGEGFVWSPSWLRIYKRVHFAKKTTFDASATPEVGKTVRAVTLSNVDVEALEAELSDVTEKFKAEDPKLLRREIASLKAELARKPAAAPPAPAKADPKLAATVQQLRKAVDQAMKLLVTINAEGFFKAGGDAIDKTAVQKAIEAAVAQVAKQVEAKVEHRNREIERLRAEAGRVLERLKVLAGEDLAVDVSVRHNEPFTVATPSSARPAPAHPRDVGPRGREPGDPLQKGERIVLTAVAQHQEGVTREQLAVLTGYKRSSRDTYLQRIRQLGYIVDGERITATAEGVAALGPDFQPLPTGPELLEHWRRKLPAGELACLEVLVAAYPEAVDRERISEATKYQRSSRDTYLQRLRSRRLITEPGRGLVRASDALFDAR